MFKDIIIGQYIPGDSWLHKMDARIKIVLTIFYIVVLFLIKTPLSYALFAVYTAALVLMSRIPIKFILKGLRPMLWILIFTVVLNLFMTPGTFALSFMLFKWQVGITFEGIKSAILIGLRLLFLITGTSLLTLTTSPLQLTDGIERLLTPLSKIKVPAHEIAMMITIAIRFIPTLAEETDKIMKAQTARGADFDGSNIIKKAKAMIPLLVPLFVSAFRRADELSTAMEARCYNGGKNRTKMKQAKITKIDIFASGVFIACVLLLFVTEFVIEIF